MIIGRAKEQILERSTQIRALFKRSVNDALRKKFCDKQSGLCALGKKPLISADGAFTQIDHIMSVWYYAESSLPIEEACRVANAEENLQLVCINCGTRKNNADLEESSISFDCSNEPQKLTVEQIETRRQKLSEVARKGGQRVHELYPNLASDMGRKSGRKHAENKTGVCGRSPEKMSQDGIKGGSFKRSYCGPDC